MYNNEVLNFKNKAKTLLKDTTKASVILRSFFIYIWLTHLSVLSETDTYYSVYLLCGVLGILCLYDNYKTRRNCPESQMWILRGFIPMD